MRSVTEFLMECGFDVKLSGKDRFKAKKCFNFADMVIQRDAYGFRFWVASKLQLKTVTAVGASESFGVLLELAYDRMHGLASLFSSGDGLMNTVLVGIEEELTSMFDRIMGEWK